MISTVCDFLRLYADDTDVYQRVCSSYVTKPQASAQGVNDVLSEVRMIRVPNQTDGDDLRTVEEDTGHPELLTTLTLMRTEAQCSYRSLHLRKCSQWMFNTQIRTINSS